MVKIGKMHFLSLAALGAFASISSIVAGAPAAHQHVIHEKRSHLPQGWGYHSSVHKETVLPVRIGLTQSNLDRGHDMLMSVSDPDSENFGNHWTAKQVADFFAPSTATVEAVTEWLSDSGIRSDGIKSHANGWLEFSATVGEMEDLLKTQYYKYMHETGKPHVACEEYSIPAHLQEHVDFISPTVHFDPKVKRSPKNAGRSTTKRDLSSGPSIGKTIANNATELANKLNELTTCDALIVPACLRALYNIPLGTKNLSSYGIVEYAPETYFQTDLDEFQATPLTNSGGIPVGTAPIFKGIDGGYLGPLTSASVDFQAEPDLDLEYAMDLVYPQSVTLFQVGDNGTNSEDISFNNFLDGIDKAYCTYSGGDDKTIDEQFPDPGGYNGKEQCGVWKPSSVISTSYGYNEHDLTPKYEQRQCNEYMKLGLQGVSFLYSSGDYGVAGNGGQCIAANGSYNDGTSGKFNPSFPGGCPYVTSVGATQIPTGGSVTTPETACETVIYSGGGFSNVFPMPSYQSTAVKSYFKNHKPTYTSAQYNNTQKTRAFPDVSANGANYVVAVDGAFITLYGTSASAPVFGAVMTMINNERVALKKSPLGFLNPTFYKYPTMFNDITSGGNQGCGTAGFTAVPGWDPVTGLGTPDYNKMLATLIKL